jgi:hypothetical protein
MPTEAHSSRRRAATPTWSYRAGFGQPALATCRPRRDRPQLGEVIVAAGHRWLVYDWISGATELTLFVEQLD